MDHWAKTDEDRKAVLLTTYHVAGTFAAHYSSVRTAISIAAFALAYAVLLPPCLASLSSGTIDASGLAQCGVAAVVMVLGQFLSVRLLARTNRSRAVAISAQNRRHDDLLFHESSEDPGPPLYLPSDTRAAWLIEPFPVFYEDLFRRFRGIRSGWLRGTGNLVYLTLTGLPAVLFLVLFVQDVILPKA